MVVKYLISVVERKFKVLWKAGKKIYQYLHSHFSPIERNSAKLRGFVEDFRAYLFHNIYFWQFTSVSIIFLHITVIWRRNLTHVIDYYCLLFSTKIIFLIIYTTHLFFIQRIRQAHALLIKNKNDYVCGMRKLSSNIEHTPVHQSYYFSVLYLHLKQIFKKKILLFRFHFISSKVCGRNLRHFIITNRLDSPVQPISCIVRLADIRFMDLKIRLILARSY